MILLTGFEPFGGNDTNPSWDAVQLAAELLRADGLSVECLELPCVFGTAGKVLRQAVDRLQPAIVVCVGLAGGRERISLERVAINCDDAVIPDNAGTKPVDEEVVSGGPAAYFTSLPLKAALRELRIAGVRAEVSQTAGTYVCNHVFYTLMHHLQGNPGTKGGFIHVPFPDTHVVAGGRASSMTVEEMAEAIAVVVRTAAQTAEAEPKLSAGGLP